MADFTNMKQLCPTHFFFIALFILFSGAKAEAEQYVTYSSWVTRARLPVLYVETPNSPWAVVQLHVRSNGSNVTADEHHLIGLWMRSMAEGKVQGSNLPSSQQQIEKLHGEVRAQQFVDQIIISDGIPAASFSSGLRAMNDRLKYRHRLSMSALTPLSFNTQRFEDVPLDVRQSLFPTHPYAFSRQENQPNATNWLFTLNQKLLKRQNIVLVVTGPMPAQKAQYVINTIFSTALPGGGEVIPTIHLPQGVRTIERSSLTTSETKAPPTMSVAWFPITLENPVPTTAGEQEQTKAQAKRFAALKILAQITGGQTIHREGFALLVLKTPLSNKKSISRQEVERLKELEHLARFSIKPQDLDIARALCQAQLIRQWRAPEELAKSLGGATLRQGTPEFLNLELAAYDQVSPEDIQSLARELTTGTHIMLRDAPSQENQ